MIAATLGTKDLEEELRTLYTQHRAVRSAAYYARGEAGSVTVKVGEDRLTLQVVPVGCELELRQALLLSPPVVALVDYATDLPPDVTARLAGRKLQFPTPEGRLRRKFGGVPPAPDLLQCEPLCRALLADPDEEFKVDVAAVGLETAFRALLVRSAGFPEQGALSVELVLAFCATAIDAGGFRPRLLQNKELREALLALLSRVAGKVAAIAWRAWERGEGKKAAALALILEVAAKHLQGYLRGSLVQLLERLEPGLGKLIANEPQTLERWGEAAEPLGRRLAPKQLTPVLDEAATMLPDLEAAEALKDSRVLRQSLTFWRTQLAGLLTQLARRPARAELQSAYKALHALSLHVLESEDPPTPRSKRLTMALRLAGFLVWSQSPEAQLPSHGPPHEAAVVLAERYAQYGGFVDYARAVARSHPGGAHSDDPLDAAIALLVRSVDAVRDKQDAQFAQALPAWLAAGRPHDRVLPIEHVLDRIAVPFLKDHPQRKLLVLLLDGMSWVSAVELTESLELRRGLHFAPLRWHPERKDRIPTVMAALPTLTEVSRAALFAGKLPLAGSPSSTTKDPERFAEHVGLSRLTAKPPKLLLRPELETPTGDASGAALDLVCSAERVVGVVVNAIDEQLHGSRQLRVAYDHQTIKPIEPLLLAAATAGRAILLVADHGHVPGSRLEHIGQRSAVGGARWRTLAADETTQPHEIRLDQNAVWRPRGKPPLAVLFRETDTYGSTGSAGEHGGVALAEVIAPALLIGAEDLSGLQDDDPEQAVKPLERPAWWSFDLETPAGPTTAAKSSTRAHAARPAKEPSPQLVMAEVLPATPEPEAPPADTSALRKMVLGSLYFKGITKEERAELEKAIGALEILAAARGAMGADAFANKLGLLPSRVPGYVVDLDERFNIDGNQVVRYDRQSCQVTLHLDLLKSLYGAG